MLRPVSVSVLQCPQCSAPLTPPSRFAREATCQFCGTVALVDPFVVATARFKEAARARASAPERDPSFRLGGVHWLPQGQLARGERSDVFLVESARWPRERAVLKVARGASNADSASSPDFLGEWRVLEQLRQAPGGGALGERLLRPISEGTLGPGIRADQAALLYGFAPGYLHTLLDVRRAFAEGVRPEIAVWVWRRVLELLAFLHRHHVAHGAVTPAHVMVEEGEHGARLVGYGHARTPSAESEYGEDLRMSAGSVAFILGGSAETGLVPSRVPEALARRIEEVGSGRFLGDAWGLRESLGDLARSLFGPPSFHPIRWPGGA